MTSHVRSALTCLAILAVSQALAPPEARAWPHEGVEVRPGMIYRRFSGSVDIPGSGVSTQEIYVLYVDTQNPAISFTATRPADRTLITSEFARRTQSQAAINTHFYATGGVPCGMAMGEGEIWQDSYRGTGASCAESLGITADNRLVFFDCRGRERGPAPMGVRNVVSGMPPLVRGGVVVDEATITGPDYPSHMGTANPRTAICEHEDRRSLVFVVVDGRVTGRTGMRGITLARFLRNNLGCRDGFNLDGGGSSTLFVEGQTPYPGRPSGVVNRTSDGTERAVCCHLGVRWRTPVVPDAGMSDGGPPSDAGLSDAGTLDSSAMDSAGPDAGATGQDATAPRDASFAFDTNTTADATPPQRVDASSSAAEPSAGTVQGSCGCRAPGRGSKPSGAWTLALLTGVLCGARARRRARAVSSPH